MQKIWTYCLAILLGVSFLSASPENNVVVVAPTMETFTETGLLENAAAAPPKAAVKEVFLPSSGPLSSEPAQQEPAAAGGESSGGEASSSAPDTPEDGSGDSSEPSPSSPESMEDAQASAQAAPETEYYVPEIPLSEELQYFTYQQCLEKEVSYDLVLAMMFHESRFDPNAMRYYEDGSSDSGLMQINSINAKSLNELYGITDLTDPYENIEAGVSIISGFVNRYGENDGLMAYNMGAGGYQTALANGVTTTAYAQKILTTKSEYERLRGRL